MNEYSALFECLKEAYYTDYKNMILETDHVEDYWNWYNFSVFGGPPEYASVMQQLNQQKADKNFKIHVRLVDEDDDALTAYLARYGAKNWKQMLAIREMFGRVRELWMLDMGLRSDEDMFQVDYEEELDHKRMGDEVVNPEGNDGKVDEMDIGDENQVVVVGLAVIPNQNVVEQFTAEVGGNAGEGANPNEVDA